MKKENLFRFSAVCSALSGLLLIIGWTLNINRDSLPGALLVLFGYVLALFAFMGIYGIQYKRLKIFGFLGFVLIVIANALFIPWVFLDIARISGVAAQVDWKEVEANGPTLVIGVLGGVGFVLGFFLLGYNKGKSTKSMACIFANYRIHYACNLPLVSGGKAFTKNRRIGTAVICVELMALIEK